MILLLGGAGYVGTALARALIARGLEFSAPTRHELDVLDEEALRRAARALRPRFAINAIGFTGRPNIDGTERERLRCLQANTVVPGILAKVFTAENIPWGHVSSGCIFDGTRPDGTPFDESDPPNFAFGDARAGWYAKTKAMAESLLRDAPRCLIWRMRIPFDEYDHPRNYLTKLVRYPKLLEVTGSISRLGEFADAAIESLWREVPSGIYNLTNPGVISTSEVVAALRRRGILHREPVFYQSAAEFLNETPGRVYRANCALESKKIAAVGIPLREVHESLEEALAHWVPERQP